MDIVEVFSVIKTERSFQKARWGDLQPDGSFKERPHEVEAYITYMRYYLRRAEEAVSVSNGSEIALHELRKVVALGVHCFEEHGVSPRTDKDVQNGRNGIIYPL